MEEETPPEEEPPPVADQVAGGDQRLPVYCVSRGPESSRGDLGIWTGTWDQLRQRLGFVNLFGSGFRVKRCASIEGARAYWVADGRRGTPLERRLNAGQGSSSS